MFYSKSFHPAPTCQIFCLDVPFPEGHPNAGEGEATTPSAAEPSKMLR
jgi:hypothetical protein